MRELNLKVESGIAALGEQAVAASLTMPNGNWNNLLLVCLPGGGYSRFYFQAVFDGFASYNFAEYMSEKGYAVLTIDHLGMGDSAKPEAVHYLDKSCIAAYNHAAVQAALQHLGGNPVLIGIGHSMGGMALVEQQAHHATYNKVCILGWTNIGLNFETPDLEPQTKTHHYAPTNRAQMHGLFHMPDVPRSLIMQDDARASLTPSPFAMQALKPGIVAAESGSIICPVYLGYGELDISPTPNAEPSFYNNAASVEMNVLKGSAHNHNYAQTRTMLWDEIASFSTSTA